MSSSVTVESPHFRINLALALDGVFREGDGEADKVSLPPLPPLPLPVFILVLRAATFLAISSAVTGAAESSDSPGEEASEVAEASCAWRCRDIGVRRFFFDASRSSQSRRHRSKIRPHCSCSIFSLRVFSA